MSPSQSVLLDHGGHSFIAFATGRKWLYAVALGQPCAIVRLPRAHQLDDAVLNGKPYPVRRAARIYLKSGFEISLRARRVLRLIAKGETEVLA